MNDNFTDAEVLAGSSAFISGSNTDATIEGGEPQINETYLTVWYVWQAPTSGVVNIYTDGSSFDTVLAVFTGSSISQLVSVASNDDEDSSTASLVVFQANAGVTYFIQVGGYGDACGDIQLSLICAGSCVANDNFDQACLISGTAGRITGTSSHATVELGEPGVQGGYGGHSVWYHWVAPHAGNWAFTTDGSGFDTILGVCTGHVVSALTTLVYNDDQDVARRARRSRVRFGAVSNAEFFVFVDGYSRDSGAVILNWGETPANDNLALSWPIAGRMGAISANNVAASYETIEPSSPGMRSIWYRWVAPSTGLWTINTQQSDFDTWLGVYMGATISNLVSLASSDDVSSENHTSSVVMSVTNGVGYFIEVNGISTALPDGSVDYSDGNIRLNWFPFAPEILQSSFQSNQFGLSFWTTYGTNYITERTCVLTNDQWDVVTNCAGCGVIMPVLDRNATNAQGFYRVRAE